MHYHIRPHAHERQDTALPSALIAVAVLLSVYFASKGHWLDFALFDMAGVAAWADWRAARALNHQHGIE